MFMPAAYGCENKPIYPYEIISIYIYGPYIFGLSVLVFLILRAFLSKKTLKKYIVFHYSMIIIWFVSWGYEINMQIITDSLEPVSLDILFPFVLWWGIIIPFFKFVRKNWKDPEPENLFYRSVWIGALMAISLFAIFIPDRHFYGLNISFTAALVLLCTGLIEDYKTRIAVLMHS
jgi:hypothetical protein